MVGFFKMLTNELMYESVRKEYSRRRTVYCMYVQSLNEWTDKWIHTKYARMNGRTDEQTHS